jgi:hypothetical protein
MTGSPNISRRSLETLRYVQHMPLSDAVPSSCINLSNKTRSSKKMCKVELRPWKPRVGEPSFLMDSVWVRVP